MHIRIVLLCLITAFVGACSSFKSGQERIPAATYYVDPQYHDHQTLMAEILSFRANALRFAQEKKLDESTDVTFTRAEGDLVREMGTRYLEAREKILKMSFSEERFFAGRNQVKMSAYKGTREETKKAEVGPRNSTTAKYKVLYVDPKDAAGERHIFRIHMALASALMLMDNYLVAIRPFNDNPSLRYALNYDVPHKKALQELADSYASSSHRSEIEEAIKFVDEVMAWRRSRGISTSPEESQLYSLTQSSIWYLAVKNNKTGNSFADAIANFWDRITLRGKRGARVVSYGLSMGFGNMVGLVETRKGYLYHMSESEKDDLIAEMKPLDVLMEKTPFRLTDKMIPGHYGHVAIWLGTESQLKDLGVWEQIPVAIQTKIRSGHRIVEALRPGVELNALEHFLNIDDFLVLRDTRSDITDEYRRKAILQAVAQIGKEYDFNFDVHTHERIVCSEIAYVVFSDVKWPLEETLKRYTISPDNVAQLAVGQSRMFEPVIMYYGGKRVYKQLPYSLSLLLKANENSYAEFERIHNL